MQQFRLAFCDLARKEPDYLALCKIIMADGKPPAWIMLVPAGDKIEALDGREFSNSDPQGIVDAFNADPRDLPIDWNHAEEKKAPLGEEAPAAGWVDKMELRAGAVWGQSNWTPRGAASLISKESRYISPAFSFDKKTKIIQKLFSAGLVNSPAFDMPALANNQPPESTMTPEQLAALGLTAKATPEEITAAILKLKAGPEAELTAVKKELETARSKISDIEVQLANARNANPTLDKFVPRADHDVAVARVKTLEAEKCTAEKTTHDSTVEGEVEAAMKAGKVTPATKAYYVKTCETKDGLEMFRTFIKDAPVIGDPSKLGGKTTPGADDVATLSAAEKSAALACGLSEESVLATKKADAAARATAAA